MHNRYATKVKAHAAGMSDDPLAASPLEAACLGVRADLARGLGFGDAHPLAAAAKTGALYSAEMVGAPHTRNDALAPQNS